MTPDDRARLLSLVDRLENYYAFECEGGPLRNCVEWQELRAALLPPVGQECYKQSEEEAESYGTPIAQKALLSPVGQEEPQGWQPIETAQKDSSRILICATSPATGESRVYLAWWAIPYEAAPDERGWWETGLYGTSHPVVPQFTTHWMPLPAPPLVSKASAEGEEPQTIGQCTARHSSGRRCQLPWPHYGNPHWSDGFSWPNSERPAVARKDSA